MSATPPTPELLDGAAEVKLIALRFGKPPAGYCHWTLRLLFDQLLELEIVESISPWPITVVFTAPRISE